ncbi:MAG: UDP-3-O-(3-hydroxymyristoyl)glucosamine N-acyltransferase [candidate division Zixibacteria bacterium]|nr:UDP-3-O-(3-hydroxymyristoyl)glucosamine N-acyltransferase [candidate division Zixibacteria bacterium]
MTSSTSNKPLTLIELSDLVGGTVEGDGRTLITGAAPIESAQPGDVSFVANPKYSQYIETTAASALVLDLETACTHKPVIRHKNPYLTFAKILDRLYADPILVEPGISKQAIVEPGAHIGARCSIGPLCHIRASARIGDNCTLVSSVYVGDNCEIKDHSLIHPGVRVLHGTRIGCRAIIHAGTVLGSDGFGFAPSPEGMKKIKQIGWVEVGDDVEIGANVTIDRGALGPTVIGNRTKIDNLVQIAHNVQIGDDCLIVSQVGISGSTKLGNRVVLAGQVGLVGHIEIGDDVKVGAQSGIPKSVPAGKTMFGYPARDIMETMRIEAALTRLPELLKRVKRLEGELKKSSGK